MWETLEGNEKLTFRPQERKRGVNSGTTEAKDGDRNKKKKYLRISGSPYIGDPVQEGAYSSTKAR